MLCLATVSHFAPWLSHMKRRSECGGPLLALSPFRHIRPRSFARHSAVKAVPLFDIAASCFLSVSSSLPPAQLVCTLRCNYHVLLYHEAALPSRAFLSLHVRPLDFIFLPCRFHFGYFISSVVHCLSRYSALPFLSFSVPTLSLLDLTA